MLMETAGGVPGTRRTVSLRIQVATILITALLLIGGVLGWFGWRQATAILLSASDRLVGQVSQEVETAIRAAYGPAVTTVDLLSRSPFTRARDDDQRWSALPLMVQGLINGPQFEAVYAAWDDGDFFIVRPLRDEAARQRFDAPPEARYRVAHSELDEAGVRKGVRVFFDADLIELQRERYVGGSFDPTSRPWYESAITRDERVLTEPYIFKTTRAVGITTSRRFELGGGVIGADVTLDQLSQTLAGFDVSPSAELVLLDYAYRVLADSRRDRPTGISDASGALPALDPNGTTPLHAFARVVAIGVDTIDFEHQGRRWTARQRSFSTSGERDWILVLLVPEDELLSEATRLLHRYGFLVALMVIGLIPLAWFLASIIATPLQKLSEETRRIRGFDFSEPVSADSYIKEIHELAGSLNQMKSTIANFLGLIGSLSRERAYDQLLHRVLEETMTACHAEAGAIYLLSDDETELAPVSARAARGDTRVEFQPRAVAMQGQVEALPFVEAVRDDEARLLRVDHAESPDVLPRYFEALEARVLNFVVLPLHNRKGQVMGLLCLAYPETGSQGESGQSERVGFVTALSGFAAVSIESQRLLKMEKQLLDSFIRLIAGAIDSKSPYTGGHCQRVPALTMMLARAAERSDAAPFTDFALSEEQWEELNIASWLHDCGKVTTPEYVVDKATKLETIYDRIHEVRMRFEVLKRDVEIRYWQGLADGGDRDELARQRDAELEELDEEFRFVAECNQGGEFMAPERVERLHAIAARRWRRTLDDRVGLSWDEQQRKERTPAPALPVEEPLLADREEHLIERDAGDASHALAERGFKLDVPEHAYNRGELYNLAIARGTLSEEERFKINDHIVQTILMLEELPFPKHLRNVPGIAGGHHEKMDGTGYPKRLSRTDMPMTARMMAIADIFEALTASDRPYKKAKTLSEAIRIMGFMRKDQHIDAELFTLFLESGVYLEYANQFLDPEQIDEVDVSQYTDS